MMSKGKGETLAEWRAQTRELLEKLPEEYGACRTEATTISQYFHEALAEAFQSRLNRHVKALPQEAYGDRQVVASFVNHELRELGLAIRCPKTGLPAILIADLKDAQYGQSRFRLEVRLDDGRKVRTRTSIELFDLELMEDKPRREGMARWAGR